MYNEAKLLLEGDVEKRWDLVTYDRDFLNLTSNSQFGIIVVKIYPAIDRTQLLLMVTIIKSSNSKNFCTSV